MHGAVVGARSVHLDGAAEHSCLLCFHPSSDPGSTRTSPTDPPAAAPTHSPRCVPLLVFISLSPVCPPLLPSICQDPVPLDKFDEWIDCKTPGVKADLSGEPAGSVGPGASWRDLLPAQLCCC